MVIHFCNSRINFYGMIHVLFTVSFCFFAIIFITCLSKVAFRHVDIDGCMPQISRMAYILIPYSWSILILSIFSGIVLLFLKIRSRSIFVAYTAFFVLLVTAWTFFSFIACYAFDATNIDFFDRKIDRHRIVEHQRPSPLILVIDEQSVWKTSGYVFNYTVSGMGDLMKKERPELAKMFHDSISYESPEWSELDMRDFSYADREYVLTILKIFRQQFAEEKNIEFDKYDFPCCESPMSLFYEVSEKKLAEFENLLQQSIDRLRNTENEDTETE